MTNIHDIVLQIKDKNVIWEDKAEEVYFNKKKVIIRMCRTQMIMSHWNTSKNVPNNKIIIVFYTVHYYFRFVYGTLSA